MFLRIYLVLFFGLPTLILGASLDQSRSECGSPHPQWIGDNFCDDDNNNAGCGWDGGDCCGGNTDYCYKCECLDPNFV